MQKKAGRNTGRGRQVNRKADDGRKQDGKGRLAAAGRRVTRTKQEGGRQEYCRQVAGKDTASRKRQVKHCRQAAGKTTASRKRQVKTLQAGCG